MHGGGWEGLVTRVGDGDSIPRVFIKKCFSLSENWGLGIAAAKALNNGISCRGELNSLVENSQSAPMSDAGSLLETMFIA